MESKIIGVRFQKIGKIYHFDAAKHPDIQPGDFVVVETSRGIQLGEVTQNVKDAENPRESSLKPISRKASPRDLVLRQVWNRREDEAIKVCRQSLSGLKIEGVKIVSAEYTLDGKRLTLLYTSEGDERVDLSELDREMKNQIPRTRIDFRQIGPRDAAKIIGGMGVCGLPNRCCSKFLVEFSPISIRMAKAQGVSLAPTEITGMCGRLRCCLVYEYEHYVEARKELPKEKRRVSTPMGEGKVVNVYPLVRRILVDLGEAGYKEFDVDELRSPVEKAETKPESKGIQESVEQNQSPRSNRTRSETPRRKGKRRR
jgi:cell fate regulator YaaT (PSP1 superfamily)